MLPVPIFNCLSYSNYCTVIVIIKQGWFRHQQSYAHDGTRGGLIRTDNLNLQLADQWEQGD
jgi:hypothetical protein